VPSFRRSTRGKEQKFVSGITFLAEDELGIREVRDYSNDADSWMKDATRELEVASGRSFCPQLGRIPARTDS
jgi:hypothetical protein